jgi:uncharacterized membrane protein
LNQLIHPNWHVILIHVPLGVFVLGVLIELFAFLYRHSPVRTVARGMIWLGALSAIPAAYSGVYAFADVVRRAVPAGAADAGGRSWNETRALATGVTPAQWDLLGGHVWCQAVATLLGAVLVTVAFGANDRWRQRLHWPLMAGLLFALVAMGWGAYYGGEMVYRYGVAVDVVQGSRTAEPAVPTVADGASAATQPADAGRGIEYFVPPLQLHVTLAGLAAALSFAALGMSLRVLSTADQWRDPEVGHARNLIDLEAGPRGADADAYEAARTSPDADAGHGPVGIPSARFWLFTSLLALLTALAGYWFLAGRDDISTWKPQELWKAVSGKQRRLYHVITGVSIVVLPLLLALVARFARRSRFLLGFFAALMILALAAQVWFGVLLLFDTPNGKLTGFNSAAEVLAK